MPGGSARRRLAAALAVATATGMHVASSIPQARIPHPPGRTDLLLHALAFGALALFVDAAIARPGFAPALLTWTVVATYGALDELHQARIPGRNSTLSDWLADALGAACALGAVRWVVRRRRVGRGAPAAS